jgi:type I restriction enzyme S subunit
MSSDRYPAYKDSGVVWLGQVPAHWDLRRIGFVYNERREKVSDRDFPALSVTKNGIVPQLETAAKTDDGDNRKKVVTGDFVINSRSDRKGSSGVSALTGSVSLICTVLMPQMAVVSSYANMLFRSIPFQEEFYRNGQGIVADLWTTNFSNMKDIVIPLPPLAEQQAIAAFLDRECARIDALVAAQQRMITLLCEKRQAQISHAVTRGLDPAAPLRDPGVAWLGQVPAHWEVKRLNVLGTFLKGSGGTKEDITTEGIPCIRYGELYGKYNVAIETPINFIAPEMYPVYTPLLYGDVVFAASGEKIDEIGKSAVYLGQEPAACGGDTVIFRANTDTFYGRFLGYTCDSSLSQQQKSSMYRGTTIKHIYPDELKNLIVALPPLAEQQAIAAFLDDACGRIDALIGKAEQAIALLQERRSAVIAAAVTGQIKVMG